MSIHLPCLISSGTESAMSKHLTQLILHKFDMPMFAARNVSTYPTSCFALHPVHFEQSETLAVPVLQ